MRKALLAALGVVALLTPEARADNTFELQPILMSELDLRLHSNKDLEAYDGFDVDRFRLGARVFYTQWFAAVAQVELVGEKPTILDARVVVKPSPAWELTFGAGPTPLFSSARDEPIGAPRAGAVDGDPRLLGWVRRRPRGAPAPDAAAAD